MTDLRETVAVDILRPIDQALVRLFSSRVPGLSSDVLLAAGLVSYQLGRGHVCLDLVDLLEDPLLALGLADSQPDTEVSEAAYAIRDRLVSLSLSAWQGSLLAAADLVAQADRALTTTCPLVISGERLYLRRYWQYERSVEASIRSRLKASVGVDTTTIDDAQRALFVSTLSALFAPQEDPPSLDWQKMACAIAARGRFTVITGGPGTGKTTTVVRLLVLLQTMALASSDPRPLRVAVAAPTGKAAARLRSALLSARALLPASLQQQDALMQTIPTEVTTLHKLLGARVDARGFQHDARHPLPIDLLVIDEASMIDLEMMAAVVDALSDSARLVLLGDKDQLSSVEAGGVLGQLCSEAEGGGYRPDTARWLLEVTGLVLPQEMININGRDLDQQVVMLRQSRRFDPSGGIGRLAAAIHSADSDALLQVLGIDEYRHSRQSSVGLHDLAGPLSAALDDVFRQSVNTQEGSAGAGIDGFLRVLYALRPSGHAVQSDYDDWASQVLQARGCFQVLCALRDGRLGLDQINLAIENFLARAGLVKPQGLWYEGRPVLVTRNDYGLGLMNGDMGVALSLPVVHLVTGHRTQALRVAFFSDTAPSGVRWVLPSRLTSAETGFALTVHKSQGSEFDECLLVLPDARYTGLTRELLYTGITRARRRISIAAQGRVTEVLMAGISRFSRRAGGLFG